MIGTYRFALSVFVVAAHLWDASAAPLSNQAVFSFYVLSGFLMTMVLNETYGFAPTGFARFWGNRILRLWPVYLVTVAVVGAHIAWIGPLNQKFPMIQLPTIPAEAIVNVTILGISGFRFSSIPSAVLVPNAWSLSVEIFCYLLLSLYFAKSPRRAFGMLLIGAVVTALRALSEQNSEYLKRTPKCLSRFPRFEENQRAQILNPTLEQSNRFTLTTPCKQRWRRSGARHIVGQGRIPRLAEFRVCRLRKSPAFSGRERSSVRISRRRRPFCEAPVCRVEKKNHAYCQ